MRTSRCPCRSPDHARLPDDELAARRRSCWCRWSLPVRASSSSSSAARRPSSLARLAHRGQRHGGGRGEVDVVVADDREVVGHARPRAAPSPAARPRASRSLAQKAAVGRRRGGHARRSARPASRPPATVRCCGERTVRASSEPQPRAPPARRRRAAPATCGRPAAPPTKAIRRWPRSSRCVGGQPAAEDVVDGDRALVGGPAPGGRRSTTGHAALAQRVQARARARRSG